MALKVELKPGERIIIGDCVVTNADQRTRLVIEGEAPILREKDILTPSAPTRRPSASISRCSSCTRRRIRARTTRSISAGARHRAGGAQHVAAHRKHQQSYLNRRNV